jgi:hypothetical protein
MWEKVLVTVFGIILMMCALALGGYVCWRWGYQQAAHEAWEGRLRFERPEGDEGDGER